MGIYIKGISKEEFLSMYHSTRHGTYIGFNPEAITEIEEPHGRLIDTNVLCERLLTAWDTADKDARQIICEVMADAVTPIVVGTKTVIEAEGE